MKTILLVLISVYTWINTFILRTQHPPHLFTEYVSILRTQHPLHLFTEYASILCTQHPPPHLFTEYAVSKWTNKHSVSSTFVHWVRSIEVNKWVRSIEVNKLISPWCWHTNNNYTQWQIGRNFQLVTFNFQPWTWI